MMVRAGKAIREQIMKNLLFAHERIAEHGETKALIVLSKFILKFSKQFDNEFFDNNMPPNRTKNRERRRQDD